MREYYEVDSLGKRVEVHLVGEYDVVPFNWFPSWGQRVFFDPKWDFELNDWVEGDTNDSVLERAKESKIFELNSKCRESILGRFTATINNIEYSFSCDLEAQANFEKVDRAFEKGRITEIPWTSYNTNGEVIRLLLTPETFEIVYIAHLNHIQNNISKFRDFLQPMILEAKTPEEVFSIQW